MDTLRKEKLEVKDDPAVVTLTFVFDQNKIKEAGLTEEELLCPMREHAKKYEIEEIKYGVFCKEGEDALCVVGMFIPDIIRIEPKYMDYLDEWTLDVDGEKEDCIKETREWLEEHKDR